MRPEGPQGALQVGLPSVLSMDAGMQTEELELGAPGTGEQRSVPASSSPSAGAVGLSGGTLALVEESLVGTLEGGNSEECWHWDVERS